MRTNRDYERMSYENLTEALFHDAEEEMENAADLSRRAYKLSAKKELERLEHLKLIQEQNIRIRQLQDSYDLIAASKWWKLTGPIRKIYGKLQKAKGEKTIEELLSEIQDNSRYEREDYQVREADVFKTCMKEFADDEKEAGTVLTDEYKDGDCFDVTVSVIIPTFNAGPDFREVLTALKGQKGIGAIEIIVVDSGSTDQTIEECRFAGIEPICISQNDFTHSYARNLGAEQAKGEYLLFMTQDAEPTDRTWMYRLLSVLITGKAAAASPVEMDNGRGDLKYRIDCWNHKKYLGLDQGDKLTAYREDMEPHEMRRHAQLTDVANIISKELFMKYRFSGDYAEDLRLGLSLIKDGYSLAQLTSVQVRHAHNRSAEYIKKRTYIDRKALCEMFPALAVKAADEEKLISDLDRGDEPIKAVLAYMNEAKSDMDNIVVYGRALEHAVQRFQEEDKDVLFMDWLKLYIRSSLIPYIAEHNAFVADDLHEKILDTVYKAYYFEVGTRIADYEIAHGPEERILKHIGNDLV